MADESPMEENQLKGDLSSAAQYTVASPPAMNAWERVGRNTAIGGVSPTGYDSYSLLLYVRMVS